MQFDFRWLIPAVLIAVPALAADSTRRGITAEDYFAFESIADAHISPDGQQAAYVLTTVDRQKNRRDASIWMVSIDGKSAPRRLTAEGANSTSPRWSPDGSTLAFLSARAAAADPAAEAPRPQICILPMEGGEAQTLTHLKNGAGAFQWSPDGKRLVTISRTGPSDSVAPSARKSDVRHYSHISYKFNDTGWFDDKRGHLWVVDAATGSATQITSGDDWNDADPQWSPDSSRIAFVSDRTGHEYDGGYNTDVWVIAAAGGTLVKISDHNFEDAQPRWSPDGAQIAFAGQTGRRQFPKLYIASAAGGAKSALAVEGLDLIPTALHWEPGASELRFEALVTGKTHIFCVDRKSQRVAPVTSGERAVRGLDINQKAGVMTYTANTFQRLDDLYAAALDGSGERPVTPL